MEKIKYLKSTDNKSLEKFLSFLFPRIENALIYDITDIDDFTRIAKMWGLAKSIKLWNERKEDDLLAIEETTYRWINPIDYIETNWDRFESILIHNRIIFEPYVNFNAFVQELTCVEEDAIKKAMGYNCGNCTFEISNRNKNFDFIYIDCNDNYNGANYCAIRNRETGEIYIPAMGENEYDTPYPAYIEDISTYQWINVNKGEDYKMINSNMEMENYDKITKDRLAFLNNSGAKDENGNIIFDGITFVWHKNHTMCVKSMIDIKAEKNDIAYIAIYKHHNDIKPIKLSRQKLLDIHFE